ncbi:MAG: outer-membrane lipoprotein carrier protein LolA [Leptospirales bacterium]|nr:outer-membrane lipoprotein carrier protein LolA [Leptospirales bacterium]
MKLRVMLIIILFISICSDSFAITGDEALSNFRGRMSRVGKLTGIISWSSSAGESYTGSFKYMSPNKIYVKFSNPSGKTIVSNGRSLWVYSPSSNICGVQDLGGGGSGGIAAFTSDYLAIVTASGASGYTIKLKNNEKSFNEIILVVDSSFFLRKATLRTKSGITYDFTLSNISTEAAVIPSIFDFSVPASAQIVKNPLNIK